MPGIGQIPFQYAERNYDVKLIQELLQTTNNQQGAGVSVGPQSVSNSLIYGSSPQNFTASRQQHGGGALHEMIRQFGKRLGHIRRQSECQESLNKHTNEDFRNRSQSLDGQTISKSPIPFDSDCETTYRIYESILRQGTDISKSVTKIISVFLLFNHVITMIMIVLLFSFILITKHPIICSEY